MADLLDTSARGVFVISATPFKEDGALDLDSTDTLMDFYLQRRVDGITILGIMGEAPKLTGAEARTFIRRVMMRVGDRVPVVVGVSAAGFAPMRELAEFAMDEGAAGVMVAPAPTLRTDGSITLYFQQVAETLGRVPFVLQDYPQATGVTMPPSVIRRIAETITTCVMLKHEDWPGLAKITALRDPPLLRRISILVGNGAMFFPEELRRGVDGAMTGFAYPEMMVDVLAAHAAGDDERASDVFDAYLPLMRYENQPQIGLAARKYVLFKRGAIAFPGQRTPRTALSKQDIGDVERLMARLDRRLAALK